MRELVDTTEMYLRTIYELEEEGVVPLRARIAERLEQSGPTVSQTVARMERDGLLHVRSDRSLELTDIGRDRAMSVMRKHRLAERLLTDVLGLDIRQVHDEACRWEHVMSTEVERRVVAVLDDATYSPFGNPIPGLSDLGVDSPTQDHRGVRVTELPESLPETVRIAQVNEILQVDDNFTAGELANVFLPGNDLSVQRDGDDFVFTHPDGRALTVPVNLAHAVRVEQP